MSKVLSLSNRSTAAALGTSILSLAMLAGTALAHEPLSPSQAADAPLFRAAPVELYASAFDVACVGEWASKELCACVPTIAPTGESFLGRYHNGQIELNLTTLPERCATVLALDLFIIGNWQGQDPANSSKLELIDLDTNAVLWSSTFASEDGSFSRRQSYPTLDAPAESNIYRQNALRFSDNSGRPVTDSVYRLAIDLAHTRMNMRLAIRASGLTGSIINSSWGIDNVAVVSVPCNNEGDSTNNLAIQEQARSTALNAVSRLSALGLRGFEANLAQLAAKQPVITTSQEPIAQDFGPVVYPKLPDPFVMKMTQGAYVSAFEAADVSRWSPARLTELAEVGRRLRALGPYHNEQVTLDLERLPNHQDLVVTADLFVKGNWRGNGATDIDPSTFYISTASASQPIFATTFAHSDPNPRSNEPRMQAFPGLTINGAPAAAFEPATGSASTVVSMLGEAHANLAESVYRVVFTLPHQGENAKLTFGASGLPGDVAAASWGISRVTITPRGSRAAENNSNAPATQSTSATPSSSTLASPKERFENQRQTTLLYSTRFDGNPGPEWSLPRFSVTPSGERFIGPFVSEATSLSLSELPAHHELILEADLYTLGKWHGELPSVTPSTTATKPLDPTTISILLDDGRVIFASSFANDDRKAPLMQRFPETTNTSASSQKLAKANKAATTINSLGFASDPNGPVQDATYRLRFVIPHSDSATRLTFKGAGLTSDPSVGSWGLDNVSLWTTSKTLVKVESPADMASSADGWNGLAYVNNFDLAPGKEWDQAAHEKAPTGETFLSVIDARGSTLTLPNLPSHTHMTVSVDVITMGSWTGSSTTDPSKFSIVLGDGTIIYATTIANDDGTGQLMQAFPEQGASPIFAAGTQAVATNTLGFVDTSAGQVRDGVHRVMFTIPHQQSFETLTFKAEGLPNDRSIAALGIDNLVITTADTASLAVGGGGGSFPVTFSSGNAVGAEPGTRARSSAPLGFNDTINPLNPSSIPIATSDPLNDSNDAPVIPTPATGALLLLAAAGAAHRRRR